MTGGTDSSAARLQESAAETTKKSMGWKRCFGLAAASGGGGHQAPGIPGCCCIPAMTNTLTVDSCRRFGATRKRNSPTLLLLAMLLLVRRDAAAAV